MPFGSPREALHRIAEARFSQLALFIYAYLEAAFLPIPIEAVIAPFMQLRRDILWRIAGIALAGFFAAALTGYAIGALFFEELGEPVIRMMGWTEEFDGVETFLEQYGFWAMLLIAATPMPTQIVMIGAGVFGMPFGTFVLAVLTARGLRNFGVAALVYFYGDRIAHRFAARARGAAVARPDQSGASM